MPLTPKTLEQARRRMLDDGIGQVNADQNIADFIAQDDEDFSLGYSTLKQRTQDPRAVSAFLDWSAYGTTQPERRFVVEVPDPLPEPGSARKFFSGIGEDVKGAVGEGAESLGEAFERQSLGEQGEIDTARTLIGATGKATAKIGASVLGKSLSAITPDFIEDPIKALASKGFERALETSVGQANVRNFQRLFQGLERLRKEDPVEAARIESALGTTELALTLLTAGQGEAIARGLAEKGGKTLAKVTAKESIEAAERGAAKRATKRVKDAVKPKFTKKTIEKFAKSNKLTEPTLFRGAEVIPGKTDDAVIAAVSKVEGIKKGKPITNIKNVHKRIGEIATDVEKSLKANNPKFPKKELNAKLAERFEKITVPLDITEEAQSKKILALWERVYADASGDSLGTWKALQKFDDAIEEAFGVKTFNPNTESARSIAVREVRHGVQEMIEDQVSKAGGSFIPEIREIGHLYRATENMASNVTKSQLKSGIKQIVASPTGKKLAGGALVGGGASLGIKASGLLD